MKHVLRLTLLLLVQFLAVDSHGNIAYPYSWIDSRGEATNPIGDPSGKFEKNAGQITPGMCISGRFDILQFYFN